MKGDIHYGYAKNRKVFSRIAYRKNLTQDQLGEKIGVTNKTVSRWENGNYLPPVEMLQILSKFYGVGINELLSGEHLDEKHYKENAEEYIVADLMKKGKRQKNDWLFLSL